MSFVLATAYAFTLASENFQGSWGFLPDNHRIFSGVAFFISSTPIEESKGSTSSKLCPRRTIWEEDFLLTVFAPFLQVL